MRLRRAAETDAAFLATVILLATRANLGKDWFDVLLADHQHERLPFIERLTRTAARSWWHYSRFWIAGLRDKPAAALSCFRAGDGYAPSGEAFAEAAAAMGWDGEKQGQMWQRGGYIFSCSMSGGDELWTLENLATLPEYRGRGHARALIEQAMDEGRRAGCGRMQVTTLIGNAGAIHAYESVGFELVEEKRSEAFAAAAGAPGLCRFELTL
jgi:ribosomal protein S18 acetylase RimI-like enzyme